MQVVYFPYLFLGERKEVNFDNVDVWNFGKKSKQYIKDGKLRAYVRKLLYSNIHYGRSIKDIGVLSIGATDFREFNAEKLQAANEVRLLLFLSFLAQNNTRGYGANTGHYMATAENFEFVIQNFQPDTDHISERAGKIVSKLVGGYKLGRKKFYAPSYVIKPLRFSLDGLLIEQVLRLKTKGGKRLYKRILSATDLMFEGYYNNPGLSDNARVLLQIAAFETLLDLPDRYQRKEFKDKIETYCDLPSEKKYRYSYETRVGKTKETRSRKAIWADSYYTLRNHIIHGDKVRTEDLVFKRTQRHLDIAVLFFVLLVKMLVNEKFRKKIFYDEVTWQKSKGGFVYDRKDLNRLIGTWKPGRGNPKKKSKPVSGG